MTNKKKTILVIEDQAEILENIIEILEIADYRVFGVNDGLKGVKKAIQEHPDLIICDVMMPELDGYGVLSILSKKPQTANIPFIFLTAKATKQDFRKGMSLGADDYLTKPFEPVDLLEVVEIRLEKSERIKKAFNGTAQGLKAFIQEARGQRELENLSAENETRHFAAKDVIYSEGQHSRNLYFIASGKVKIFKTNEWGKEFITAILKQGDFFGYHALIAENPHEESAVALEDTEISFIPKEDFFMLLHSNNDFSAHFIKMLSRNSLEHEEQLLNLAYNSVRKRVAQTLLALLNQLQKNHKTEFSILRTDLANLVGTASETISRILGEFKNEGLIDLTRGKIIILDIPRLEKIPN